MKETLERKVLHGKGGDFSAPAGLWFQTQFESPAFGQLQGPARSRQTAPLKLSLLWIMSWLLSSWKSHDGFAYFRTFFPKTKSREYSRISSEYARIRREYPRTLLFLHAEQHFRDRQKGNSNPSRVQTVGLPKLEQPCVDAVDIPPFHPRCFWDYHTQKYQKKTEGWNFILGLKLLVFWGLNTPRLKLQPQHFIDIAFKYCSYKYGRWLKYI